MTIWTPALNPDDEPKYQALVDALDRDIDAGILPPEPGSQPSASWPLASVSRSAP